MDGGNAIEKLVFLPKRASNKENMAISTREAATLVASGPQGMDVWRLVLSNLFYYTDNKVY